MSYFALSYVWGAVDSLSLEQGVLQDFQTPGALRREELRMHIPRTILHAIDLTRLLGTRYLWVDSLCIVQDDEPSKQEHLRQMGGIYAKANITIVAADGDDADHGLRGIREVDDPLPRRLQQRVVPFGQVTFAERLLAESDREYGRYIKHGYHSRSWTFQEYIFSGRRLIFEKDTVRWDCSRCTWYEDIDHSGDGCAPRLGDLFEQQRLLCSSLPDLHVLSEVVGLFNSSHLSYDEDCLDAFAGVATALSRTSNEGLLCGLPELFFDIALLWQPSSDGMRRRWRRRAIVDLSTVETSCIMKRSDDGGTPKIASDGESSVIPQDFGPAAHLPTWSWTGWQGPINSFSWESGWNYQREGRVTSSTCLTIPITTWYSGATVDNPDRREISNSWVQHQGLHTSLAESLPEGWTRHIAPAQKGEQVVGNLDYHAPPYGFGSHVYKHTSLPSREFWHPIPLYDPNRPVGTSSSSRFLFAKVKCASLCMYESTIDRHVFLKGSSGRWAGLLCLNNEADATHGHIVELVAISRGKAGVTDDSHHVLPELELPDLPRRGEVYEYYNVLWVEWQNGVAYRKAMGRVLRYIWESLPLERIDLVLG